MAKKVNSKSSIHKQCEASTKPGQRCIRPAAPDSSFCTIHSSRKSQLQLSAEYDSLYPVAERFAESLQHQLESLISANDLTLGVPIERRVKEWKSIFEKLERKQIELDSVADLDDFIGLRLILLFSRDLDGIKSLLRTNKFKIFSYEDTASRLEESQFGYQSVHYVVSIPDDWLSVPTMAEFSGLKAELQVRTLAQHIWAAASHKLQYKRETSVPFQLRRSIHRVSAILETVDLEFERLLDNRQAYIEGISVAKDEARVLNVDILQKVLASKWPKQNVDLNDPLAELLDNLTDFKIETVAQLNSLIDDKFNAVLREEKRRVKEAKIELHEKGKVSGTDEERTQRGVFYTHSGLTRRALELQYPDEWKKWEGRKSPLRKKKSFVVPSEVDITK